MKKPLLIVLCLLGIGPILFAQDIIIMKSGDEIENARIIDTVDNVIFIKDGNAQTLAKDDIFILKYANGTKVKFTNAGAGNAKKTPTSQPVKQPQQPATTNQPPAPAITTISKQASINTPPTIQEPEWVGDIAYVSPNGTIPLEKQTGSLKTKASAAVYITGMGKTRTKLSINGSSSPIRIKQAGSLQFIYNAGGNDVNPRDIIQLYKLETTGKERKLELASLGTFSGGAQGDIDFIPFVAVKYSTNSYLVTVTNLPPGEYGFSLGKTSTYIVNLFGVD